MLTSLQNVVKSFTKCCKVLWDNCNQICSRAPRGPLRPRSPGALPHVPVAPWGPTAVSLNSVFPNPTTKTHATTAPRKCCERTSDRRCGRCCGGTGEGPRRGQEPEPCVLYFFNIHKSPRHSTRGVCMYGASSSPAQAGGVCMYVLTSPERVEVGLRHRRREPQSRLRHDGRRRGSPARLGL